MSSFSLRLPTRLLQLKQKPLQNPKYLSFSSCFLLNTLSKRNLISLKVTFSPSLQMAFLESLNLVEINNTSYGKRSNEYTLLVEHYLNPEDFDAYGLAFSTPLMMTLAQLEA